MTAAGSTIWLQVGRRGGVWPWALALLLVACGGDAPKPKAEDKAKKAAAAEAAPETPVAAPEGTLGENPKWKPVQPLFEAYTRTEIGAVADFSLDNTTLFIERPAVQQAPLEEQPTEAAPAIEIDPKNCATRSGVDAYRLVMLQTGLAQPKAMVVDGSNEDCTVTRGDALGNEGGRITAITQYEVVVLVPGRDKPVKLSILPPLSIESSEEPTGKGAP
jgi:hypothetical protein